MTDSTLICPVTPSHILAKDCFARYATDLAPGPEGDTPFLYSYQLRIEGGQVFVEPTCCFWIEQEGQIYSYLVHDDRIELARDHAIQIFRFLDDRQLRQLCVEKLLEINPDAKGELYLVCLSAHGVILTAYNLDRVAGRTGDSSVYAGFMPAGLSNHASMACLTGLQTCASILLHGRHYLDGSRPRYHEVRVERA